MSLSSQWSSIRLIIGGSIAIAIFCLGVIVDRKAFFACWLAAWWTCAGGVLGARANLWLHDLSGGDWGVPLRQTWWRISAAMPMLLALMLPLFGAIWHFYPWSQAGWAPHSSHPEFQTLWLSPRFVTLRLVVYAVLWQALALMPIRRKGFSAFGLIVYAITIGLASVDLIMSLVPQWYASGFGLLAIAMAMKLGFALGVAAAAKPASRNRPQAGTFGPQIGRDWGNLMLMYVLMWAYLAFTQFLIIWSENLPHEIAWYVPRLQTDWLWLGIVLTTAGFFAPLLLLLFRAVKQSRPRLRSLALILCVLGWLESVWITLPSINGMTWHTAWMAPLAMLAMTALLLAMILSPYQEIEA